MSVKCKKCGKCCKDIYLPLGTELDEDQKTWVGLHNLKLVKLNGYLQVHIKNKCSKLINGECSIYEHRPIVCQKYNCKND